MTHRLLPSYQAGRDVPFGVVAAGGLITGVGAVHLRAVNPAVANAEETLWEQGGIYAYLGAASVLKVSSTSANDDGNPVGAGARTVFVSGLDASYDLISETVILDGQTAVNTVGEYLRLREVYVATVGATGSNEGVIYVGTGNVVAGVPDNKYGRIPIGGNRMQQGLYTVPDGKMAHILHGVLSFDGDGTAALKYRIMARPSGGAFLPSHQRTIRWQDGQISDELALAYVARTDLEIRATLSAAGPVIAEAMLEILEVDA